MPTIDGVNATDPSSQGQLYGASAIDTLSEINVKMSNYQAEYGGSAGGIVNLTTRSGGKELHGDVYLYLRNEDLNANDFFNNKNKVVKPRYRYGIGGISVGGPMSIFMPRQLKRLRNKVFFSLTISTSIMATPARCNKLRCPQLWNGRAISRRAPQYRES